MKMGQGVRTGLGHGGITCVLQTQFSSFYFFSPSIVENIIQDDFLKYHCRWQGLNPHGCRKHGHHQY